MGGCRYLGTWGRQCGDPLIVLAWAGASVAVSVRMPQSSTAWQAARQEGPSRQLCAPNASTSNSEISAASWLGLNLYRVSIFLSLNAYRINGIYNQKP